MNLVRLIYCSESAVLSSLELIRDIIRLAEKTNPLNQITGFLCFDATQFLQVIEGPAAAVNQLNANFHRDKRHKNITLIEYRAVTERTVPGWAMGDVDLAAIRQEVLYRYSASSSFHPARLTAGQALGLLIALEEIRSRNRAKHGL